MRPIRIAVTPHRVVTLALVGDEIVVASRGRGRRSRVRMPSTAIRALVDALVFVAEELDS